MQHVTRSLGLSFSLLALTSCASGPGAGGADGRPPATLLFAPSHAPADGPAAKHVVVIAIDGVRAREIFSGTDLGRTSRALSPDALTPNLHALAERGFAIGIPGRGAPFRASGPNYVSLPGYTEILSGSAPACQENHCNPLGVPTLLEPFLEAGDAEPVAFISSWSRLRVLLGPRQTGALVSVGQWHRRGFEPHLGGAELRSALERGRATTNEPGNGDYRPDARTIEVALATMQTVRPRFLFVSLGDTDEHAHDGHYDQYVDALHRADRFVGAVAGLAATWSAEGEPTTIFVTTDHGRAENFRDHGREHPESADVWLVAAGTRIPRLGQVALDTPRTLSDVSPLVAAVASVDVPAPIASAALAGDLRRAAAMRIAHETAMTYEKPTSGPFGR